MHVTRYLVLALACFSTPAIGQDTTPALSVALNAAQPAAEGCKLPFVVMNTHADIDTALLEAVIFDAGGQVDRLTLFDLGTLPQGRPRVRQFVIPGAACDGIGQILFNGAQACAGDGVTPAVCAQSLQVGSQTGIKVSG